MPECNAEKATAIRPEAGSWYNPEKNPELASGILRAMDRCFDYNGTRPSDEETRDRLLREIVGHAGANVKVLPPFTCDFGSNIELGDNTFVNHGTYFMDCARISIGSWCFIGPSCGLYTAIHPLLPEDRNTQIERAEPITIGDNVWLGGGVTVLPGVTIGEGAVIGAGSVVTRDIPARVLAVGNPCRVLRPLTEADRIDAQGVL